MTKRAFLAPLVLPWLLAAVSAQDTKPGRTDDELLGRIHRLLAADDPASVAMAGDLAGTHKQVAAIQPILAALARYEESNVPEEQLAVVALLDALIRIDKAVPGERIAPHFRWRTANHVVVLLARDPKLNLPQLLDLYQKPCDGFVANCLSTLLAEHDASHFAEVALRHLHPKLQTVITNPDAENPGMLPMSEGYISVHVPLRKLEGFPPVSGYDILWDPLGEKQPKWPVRGGGLRFLRTPIKTYWINPEPDLQTGAEQPLPASTLARLLRIPPGELPLREEYVCHVPWTGAADKDRRVAAARARVTEDFDRLKGLMLAKQLLSEQAAAHVRVQIRYVEADLRNGTRK